MKSRTEKVWSILRKAGIILASITFLVVFAIIASLVVPEIQAFIERTFTNRASTEVVVEEKVVEQEKLLFLSFTDMFSGTGWIDQGKTTMYLNAAMSAFTFPSLDSGFDKSNPREVVSISINQHPVFVREVIIQTVELIDEGAKTVEFYLSNDGVKWHQVKIGEWFTFPDGGSRKLLWKARFIPDDDTGTSPILGLIRLQYRAKYL